MKKDLCSISCECGYKDDWEQFAVIPGLFRCPECKREWQLALEDAQPELCVVCGDQFTPGRNSLRKSAPDQKTCGKRQCARTLAAQTVRQQRRGGSDVRLPAWMQRAEAGMCPVV